MTDFEKFREVRVKTIIAIINMHEKLRRKLGNTMTTVKNYDCPLINYSCLKN